LSRKSDFKTVRVENLDSRFSHIHFAGINVAAIKISHFFPIVGMRFKPPRGRGGVSPLGLMLSEPMSKGGKFISREFSPSIYFQDGFCQPFDPGVFQEAIDEGGKKRPDSAVKIGVREQPVPQRPAFFVKVFGLGDQVHPGNVHPGGADRITELAANAEINPFTVRRITGSSKSFRSRTRLLGSREFRSDP
jgi:hypothetical protein